MKRTSKWKIGFYNVGNRPDMEGLFGCATLGAALNSQIYAPDQEGLFVWKEMVEGICLYGTYDEVLNDFRALQCRAKLAIVLFAKGEGNERFLEELSAYDSKLRVAGGVAANAGEKGELSPDAEDVSVLLLDDPVMQPFAENILCDADIHYHIGLHGSDRNIHTLNGMNATRQWRKLQKEHCLNESNFERMTLSDLDNVNVHMHCAGDYLVAGANCVEDAEYKLRYADQETLDKNAMSFTMRDNALIIGCAGLKSAMSSVPRTGEGSLVLFLFGEIAYGRFGNLMMTGIQA